MKRFGINHAYWGTDFGAEPQEYCRRISRAAKVGFDLLTVGQEVALVFSKSDQQMLLDTAKRENVKLNYSGGFGPNQDICSDSSEQRNAGTAHLQNVARKLSELQEGAELAGAITGMFRDSLRQRDMERCWENCVNSMKEAIKVAEDHGVLFSIEVLNRYEHFLINTSEQAVQFVEQVGSPNLKILLDTYHMNIEEDSFHDAIVKAGDKLSILHIGENNRRPPGRGHIPWDEVVGALKEIDYQGDTVMEPVVLSGGIVGQYGAIWRDLTDGEDLDEAARKGLEFYRSKLASV
jgi:D-psicose/D-tagatose/L-ribulose 3-epimerase